MDLRVKKTRRAIRSAFYSLLREKPFEKITVREIAERAEINKTTFYAHYDTIYDLADELEEEALTDMAARMDSAEKLLSDPRAFVKELARDLEGTAPLIAKVSSEGMKRFTNRLLQAITRSAAQAGIDAKRYEAVGAVLVFLVNGLVGLQSQTPELARQQIDAIAGLVAEGIGAVRPGAQK